MKYLTILFLVILISCNKDDINIEKREVTEINTTYFKPKDFSMVYDSIHDATQSFVDLDNLEIYVTNDSIVIKIGMLDLPNVLTFNNKDLPMNFLNYEWAVGFDLNSDNLDSKGDIKMGISRFKSSDEKTGSILSNTQQNIWKLNGNGADYLINLSSYIKVANRCFLIAIPKNICAELKMVTPDTNVYFSTYFSNGKMTVYDFFPSRN